MFKLLALATLATSILITPTMNATEDTFSEFVEPEIKFTSDSVYENLSILEIQSAYKDEETQLITVVFKEIPTLGYCIYDVPETEYIDGFKFDDSFVTNWEVENVDFTVPHTLLIKTTYTDDIAGMLAAARDGDWSVLLSNPLTLIQLFYYLLAAISVILGGFGLWKSKKQKVKTADEISNKVTQETKNSTTVLKNEAIALVTSIVTPIVTDIQNNTIAMIEAYILAQSNDPQAKLALIELLRTKTSSQVEDIINSIITSINTENYNKEIAKQEAAKLVTEIAEIEAPTDSEDNGGLAI